MKTQNYAWLSAILLVLGLLGWAATGMAGIASTKHNLSATWAGTDPRTYKATSETQLCVFCHTPHNTNPTAPLWNHKLPDAALVYTPYSSKTLVAAAPGQPTGASKLCLSCHDGTVALGGVRNMPLGHSVSGTVTGLEAFLTGAANLGTDLRNDHPVSFTYDAVLAAANTELVSPAALTGKIKTDNNGQMQCTTCHDPHSESPSQFLHLGYTDGSGYGSPLCRTCHNKQYWNTVPGNPHRESTAQWNGTGTNPYHIAGQNLALNTNSTPKANGCESCHKPHGGTGPSQILKQDGESGVCLVCHNGSVASASKNIDMAMNKMYTHPSKTISGKHNPKRQTDGMVREDVVDIGTGNRHAECSDCHNPHAVSAGVSPSVPNVTNNLTSNVLKGVWGVQPTWPGLWGQVTSYTVVNDTQFQHEICFKCHSYYAFGASPPTDPYGMIAGGINTDQAKEFNPNNASFHPVVAAGKNDFKMTVGGTVYDYRSSLIAGMTPTSTFTCVECHSDADLAGTGPKGPHGSDVWPILWAPYDGSTGVTGSENHLCYKCHKASTYGGAGGSAGDWQSTGFSGPGGNSGNGPMKNLHYRHLEVRQVPCMGCHSAVPHGWKRKSFLIYGRDPAIDVGADPAPYNAHSKFPVNGSYDYGIPSAVNVDAVASGTWTRSICHNAGVGTGPGC